MQAPQNSPPTKRDSSFPGWLLDGLWQRFLLWKLLICVSYMFEIVFSNLENHKAAINEWNSGEKSYISIVHAFTSVD